MKKVIDFERTVYILSIVLIILLLTDNPKDACSGDSGRPLFVSSGRNDQSDFKYLYVV